MFDLFIMRFDCSFTSCVSVAKSVEILAIQHAIHWRQPVLKPNTVQCHDNKVIGSCGLRSFCGFFIFLSESENKGL